MNRLCTLSLLFAAISFPAGAVTVESANGDWSKLPQLSQRGYDHLNEKMQAKLFEIAESHQCPAFVLNQGRLDFKMSFAAQYLPDGTLEKLVLPKLDCAEAESVAGGAVLEMLQSGDYAPTGKSRNGWYQGGFMFSFAGKEAREPGVVQASQDHPIQNANDPNQIVCQKEERLGSRLVMDRICMSRAQWAEQKRLTRQTIDQVQIQRACKDTC
ncbi:MAG TPA: hypothetical protein VFU91_06715 [Sphingomicrobium sp.]|jgi:hypothetical protein|nr:hypothetical protein [Sphingomicrobium sp.]